MHEMKVDKPLKKSQIPQYFGWFDWLRAACACTVMLFHDRVFSWQNAGSLAVQIFFALSGWLIGRILINTSRSELTRFFFNRAIRIWVPYYLAVFLLLLLSVLREPITAKWLEIVFYKLTFVYNLFGTRQLAEFVSLMPQKGTLSHVWSVNAEEQFYLLAPLLLVLLAHRFGRTILLWSLIAIATWFAKTYSAIVFGVLAAVVTHRCGDIHLKASSRWLLLTVLAVSAGLMINDPWYSTASPFAAIAVVLLLAVPSPQTRVGKIAGGMSYQLYLNQWIGGFAFSYLMPTMRDSIPRHALSAISNIVLAIGLYWFIDRQLLAWRSGWFTATRGKLVTAFAYGIVALGIGVGLALMR